MPRATLSPVIDACIKIAETVGVPVGDAVAPECDMPYIVVNSVSSRRYDGPLNDIEADSADRIQLAFVGETREVVDSMRDDIRLTMTHANLDAEFVTLSANRRTQVVILDIPRGVQREDRGLPNPIFSGMDQYLIETTPYTP